MRGSFCWPALTAPILARITIVRNGESSGPDDDDETESDKLSGDDGGLSKMGGFTGRAADVDGPSCASTVLSRDPDGAGSAGGSCGTTCSALLGRSTLLVGRRGPRKNSSKSSSSDSSPMNVSRSGYSK